MLKNEEPETEFKEFGQVCWTTFCRFKCEAMTHVKKNKELVCRFKRISFFHKLKFSNTYIFATRWYFKPRLFDL